MSANMVDPVTGQPVQTLQQPSDIPKLPPVLDKPAEIRKKSPGENLKKEFIKGDGKKIRDYITKGVLIPAIKTTLWNICTKWLSMRLFDNSNPAPMQNDPYFQQPNQAQQPNRIAYWDYYNRMNSPMQYPPTRTSYDYGEPLIPSEEKAMAVQRRLIDVCRTSQKACASIGDLYQACGIVPQFPDWSWGWSLNEVMYATVRPTRDGFYILSLPTPHQV